MSEELNILEIFDERVVDCDMDVTTKDQAFRHLSKLLLEAGYIDDLEQFVADIYEREAVEETGIGEGIAIPHGKSDAVKKLGIAVGKCRGTIDDWGSLDDEPIKTVFLFCVSKSQYGEVQLRMLNKLAGSLAKGNTMDLVKEMTCYQDLIDAFSNQDNAVKKVTDIEELKDDIEINIL